MRQEDATTYPFWLGDPAPDGSRRLGLSEAWLETIKGDVVGLDLVAAGSELHRGDGLGILHTSLGAHDLRAPQGLTILRINAAAVANPALARLSPYGRGWLAEIRMRVTL